MWRIIVFVRYSNRYVHTSPHTVYGEVREEVEEGEVEEEKVRKKELPAEEEVDAEEVEKEVKEEEEEEEVENISQKYSRNMLLQTPPALTAPPLKKPYSNNILMHSFGCAFFMSI